MYRQTHFVQTDTQKIQGQGWSENYVAACGEAKKKLVDGGSEALLYLWLVYGGLSKDRVLVF